MPRARNCPGDDQKDDRDHDYLDQGQAVRDQRPSLGLRGDRAAHLGRSPPRRGLQSAADPAGQGRLLTGSERRIGEQQPEHRGAALRGR